MSGYMEGLFKPTKYLSRQAWLYPLLIYELVRGLEKTFTGGLTLGGLNVRICRRVFLQTIKYWKCHLPGFTNWGLKFVISEEQKSFPPRVDFYPSSLPNKWKDFQKIPREGLTSTPAYLRIYEGIKSSQLYLDNWITCTSHRLCEDCRKARARQRYG